MLKARIITALCLLPLVIGMLFLPHVWFNIVLGLVLTLAAWEYAALIAVKSYVYRVVYILLLLSFYAVSFFFPAFFLSMGIIFWLIATFWLIKFPAGKIQWETWRWLPPVAGFLMLCPATLAMAVLHNLPSGQLWMLFLFLLVWAADIGAYFVGRFWGTRPLAPSISPKKTIEGVYGGFAVVALITLTFLLFWHLPIFKEPLFFALIILVFLLSIIGDLVESGIKRWMNVKDSGTLLPGHGGILDRVDSLLSAAPFFALGVTLLLSYPV